MSIFDNFKERVKKPQNEKPKQTFAGVGAGSRVIKDDEEEQPKKKRGFRSKFRNK